MLEQKLNDDMKNALKEKNSVKVSVIRMLKSDINNIALKENKDKLDDTGIIKVIQKHIKQHDDSIEQFTKGNRDDLVKKEQAELEVLKQYMPQELSDDEIKDIVKAVISQTNANSKKDMGKVMKLTLERAEGKAFGKRVSSIVCSMLQ